MSKEAVEAVVGKAMLDAEFRSSLLKDPEAALAVFDLTEEEKAGLKKMDDEILGALVNALDERKSKVLRR
jgi:23S rRNA maturation mini-RNase III